MTSPNDETRATLSELFAGRYTVEEKLDWGGLALFYRATGAEGEIALAVLPLDCESHPHNGELFQTHVEPFAGLRSTDLIAIEDIGVQLGVPFVAYELVDGKLMAERLDKGALEPKKALDIARKLLSVLETLHRRNLAHGDLTPANILLDSGRVRVASVGIAPVLRRVRPSDVTGPTGRGSGKGAVRYLAPEIVGGGVGSPAGDIFSVGALLHHMVTGVPPGAGEGDEEVAFERVPGLREVVQRAMSYDPQDRWASARDMSEALDLQIVEAGVLSKPADIAPIWDLAKLPGSVPPPPMPVPKRRLWPWVLGLGLLAAAGLAAYLLRPTESEPRADTSETEADAEAETEAEAEAEAEAETEAEAEAEAETEVEAEAEAEAEVDAETEAVANELGLVGPLASGALPPRLREALTKIRDGHHFEEEDFNVLYGYCRMNREDLRGHLVLARAFMSRDWYTAALERYEHALKLEEGATSDPQVLDDLLEIVAYGDEMLGPVWPNIRRFYGRSALPRVRETIRSTPRWENQRPLEQLEHRLERLEEEEEE